MSTALSSTALSSTRTQVRDLDLQNRVSSYLGSRHFPAFRELDVHVAKGEVTVSGRLSSFYEKQVAIHACRRVAGVTQLVDRIAVAVPK